MALIRKKTPQECKIGDMVKFTTISPTDNVVYVGRIVSVGDYAAAKAYADVAAMHQGMLQTNPDLANVEDMFFLIVELPDKRRLPFAYDRLNSELSWFENNELVEIDKTTDYFLRLHVDDQQSLQHALALLRENGFLCSIW